MRKCGTNKVSHSKVSLASLVRADAALIHAVVVALLEVALDLAADKKSFFYFPHSLGLIKIHGSCTSFSS